MIAKGLIGSLFQRSAIAADQGIGSPSIRRGEAIKSGRETGIS